MIQSKEDYLHYLKSDAKAQSIQKRAFLVNLLFPNEINKFTRSLRKLEYYKNCRHDVFSKCYYFWLLRKFKTQQLKTGFIIEPNTFEEGLSISHIGPIIVNPNAKIGINCRIHPCTNIGTKAGFSDKTPVIGDNVYIGPGAKIFGDIIIADGIAVGANAVVNKTFNEPNITIAGIPAKKISGKGSKGLLVEAVKAS